MPGADLAAAPVRRRLHHPGLNADDNGGAPFGDAAVVMSCAAGQGQVTSIVNGLFTGVMGLAMSIPVAVPLIL